MVKVFNVQKIPAKRKTEGIEKKINNLLNYRKGDSS